MQLYKTGRPILEQGGYTNKPATLTPRNSHHNELWADGEQSVGHVLEHTTRKHRR